MKILTLVEIRQIGHVINQLKIKLNSAKIQKIYTIRHFRFITIRKFTKFGISDLKQSDNLHNSAFPIYGNKNLTFNLKLAYDKIIKQHKLRTLIKVNSYPPKPNKSG